MKEETNVEGIGIDRVYIAVSQLERSEKYARSQYDHGTKTFRLDGSAGVQLYASASQLSSSSHSVVNFKLAKAK